MIEVKKNPKLGFGLMRLPVGDGTLRYRRLESMWLTAALFVMFAITFLFFGRVQPASFSWSKVILVVIGVALLSAAALRTFRGPDGRITNGKAKEKAV